MLDTSINSHSIVLLEGCLKLTNRLVTKILNVFPLDVSLIKFLLNGVWLVGKGYILTSVSYFFTGSCTS